MKCADLIASGNALFSSRKTLVSLWQDIADNFYVERANFTTSRYDGEEFAAHLHSSYPLIVRRELGNSFSGILRPTNLEWFHTSVEEDESLTITGRQFLEWATRRQRQAMYDRRAMFVKATKEGDHDYATFGQCVITYEIDWSKPALLYRNWHLKDVAWENAYDGSIGAIHHKREITVRDLRTQYGKDRLSQRLQNVQSKDMDRKIKCRTVVIPSDRYDGRKFVQPWVKILIDVENEHEIDVVGQWVKGYTIPRWHTVSDSQYAYSPATVAGLPDARLIQAMTLTLLEAGEMAVRPPLIATSEAIRGDMNYYPGGVTVADATYDERLGDVLRPVTMDKSGLPFGMEFSQDVRGMLASAFYLNKLTLPPSNSKEMTAYEASQRIQEYIREALPLFEPMEHEYNGDLCEGTFELLFRAGVFGPIQDVPQELRGRDIHFRFVSPLHDAIERKKGGQFMETKELLMHAIELDPAAQTDVDVRKAFREALLGMQTPATWLRSQDEANKMAAEMAQQQQQMQQLEQMAAQGQAAQQAGAGAQALADVA